MIKLIAVNYSDAYALVEIEGSKYAVRPPFKTKGRSISSEDVVKAISLYGFLPEQKDFESWSDLLRYLSSEAIEHRKALGFESPKSENIRKIVEKAPLEQVKKFLLRIEEELIPNSEINAAQHLLTSLIRNSLVRNNDEVFKKCAYLLEECNKIEEEKGHWLANYDNLPTISEKFPSADRVYGSEYVSSLTNSVRNRRQIFCVGSV